VPIVVLSGLADAGTAARAVHDGAQDYLVKGQVDGAALLRAVRYAIERRRARRRSGWPPSARRSSGRSPRACSPPTRPGA
jgi:sigma-B regulation protein RsbU (phosphoserine phosphatase)